MYVNFQSFFRHHTRDHERRFPVGSRIYTGHQGSGKTLSMVEYSLRVIRQFPNCRVYSNIFLDAGINYQFISSDDVLDQALADRNGDDGVLILLDEAHLFFGKKTGIPLNVLTAISQQRKDRKRIVFSSQIWEELDISLRKQVKEIVTCRSLFNLIQINSVHDGETLHYDKMKGDYVANKIGTEIFKHNDPLYSCYDTQQKIVRNHELITNIANGSGGAGHPPAVQIIQKGKK